MTALFILIASICLGYVFSRIAAPAGVSIFRALHRLALSKVPVPVGGVLTAVMASEAPYKSTAATVQYSPNLALASMVLVTATFHAVEAPIIQVTPVRLHG